MDHEEVVFQPTVNIKLIKNSKSYGWEISARGFATVDEAMEIVKDADAKLRAQYPAEQ